MQEQQDRISGTPERVDMHQPAIPTLTIRFVTLRDASARDVSGSPSPLTTCRLDRAGHDDAGGSEHSSLPTSSPINAYSYRLRSGGCAHDL